MCTKRQQSTQSPEGREIEGSLDIYRIVEELWGRAEPRLSEKELEWFADSGEYTEAFMSYIADTAENIGCFILGDEGLKAYSDKHDVCGFLFLLSESVRCAQALVMVRNNAAELIRCRRPVV
jgi:hypothetical protein